MKWHLLILAALFAGGVGLIKRDGAYAGFGLWPFVIPSFITLQLMIFHLMGRGRRKG